jgi:hypothetical protein
MDGNFIGMSSGTAANMPTPGAGADTDYEDYYNGVFDVTSLKIDLVTPTGQDCLQFDVQFFSIEYPVFIGSEYNDAFVAELDVNDWSISGTTINAPHNFALAPGNKVLSINSGLTWSPALASGTAFVDPHGGTGMYTVSTPTVAGAHSLYLTIWDMGDNALDSAVYLDRLRMFNSSGTCPTGVVIPGDPTITNISPNSGPTAGGTTVVITGTELSGGTVTFGGLPATCTVNSPTQITCASPAHAAGPVDVVVTTAVNSATSAGGFTYVDGPSITNIAPNAGPTAGGQTVIITGTNFTGATNFTFGGVAATCTVNSATQVTCTTPAGTAGPVDVVITTLDGTATSTGGYTYMAPPTIGGIAPNSGPTAGGTSVIITGTNLTGGTVTFDGLPATCTVDSATQITCASPAHAAGAVDVVVTTPGGLATSTGGFTYIPAPTIGGIAPNSGPMAGGTSVVITGTNLTGGTVTCGGLPATCIVDSPTQITCTSPAHAAGAVDVVVTTPGGPATSAGGFTYIAGPAITNIAPNAGPVAGGTTVIITGTDLTGGTVTFGGLPATCIVDSPTQITCTTPAHAAGAVDVVVTTPGGPATSAGGFTYVPAPTMGNMAPNAGPVTGGTTVVLTGTGFTGGTVTFDGLPATCTVNSDTQITCTSPAHAAGPVDVVVTTVGGPVTSAGGFTYIPAPTIGGIAPNSGPTAGGTSVVISGTNLTGGTVTFGGLPATCTVNSPTQITCTSPAHAAGPVDVVVTTPGGPATSAGGFTYIPQSITSITPNSGPTGGGTAVTILGYGFTGATSIRFGDTAATCTVVSDTQIDCTTPAHEAGPVDVVIVAPLGTVTSSGGFTFIAPVFTLTASGAATVKPGDLYVYTFTYTTSAPAFNAQVVFNLPGHTTYVSNNGGYTCATVSGVVTCDLGAISTNGSFTTTLQVDRLKKVNTPLTLQATTYVMGDNGAAVINGAPTVTANTLTPFADVLYGNPSLDFVQSVWAYGITGGCVATNPLTYCPNRDITRAEMSVFIERGVHGSAYIPPVVALTYSDTSTNMFKYWIEALKADSITGGCGGTNYCPGRSITRAEVSVFLLRGKYGPTFIPAAPTGTVWLDVPVTYWAARWAERLGLDGITAGCGGGNFCPNKNVSRAEMAVLVQRTFNLPLPTP